MSAFFQQLVNMGPDCVFLCGYWAIMDFILNENQVNSVAYLFSSDLYKHIDMSLWSTFKTSPLLEQLLKFENEVDLFSDHFTLNRNYLNYTDYSTFFYLSDYTNYNFLYISGPLLENNSFVNSLLYFENEVEFFSKHFTLNQNYFSYTDYSTFLYLSDYTNYNFLHISGPLLENNSFVNSLLHFENESIFFNNHFTLKHNYISHFDYSAFFYLSDYTNYNFLHVVGDLPKDKSFLEHLLQFEDESNFFCDHFTLKYNYLNYTDYSSFMYLSNYTNYNFLHIVGSLPTDKPFMELFLQFDNESNLFRDRFTLRHNYFSYTDYSSFAHLSNYTNYNFLRVFKPFEYNY